jgi:hypothetical protein
LLGLQRALRLTGSTWILPPGIAKDPAEILQEAIRKAFKDPAFHEAYKKATGEDATPVMPEELQRIVKEVPRDPEIVAFSGSPARSSRTADWVFQAKLPHPSPSWLGHFRGTITRFARGGSR